MILFTLITTLFLQELQKIISQNVLQGQFKLTKFRAQTPYCQGFQCLQWVRASKKFTQKKDIAFQAPLRFVK